MKLKIFILLFLFSVSSYAQGVISISADDVVLAFKPINGKGKAIIKRYRGNRIPDVSYRLLNEKYKKAYRKGKKIKSIKDLKLPKIFKLYDEKVRYSNAVGTRRISKTNFVRIEFRYEKPVVFINGKMQDNKLLGVWLIKEGIEQKINIPRGYYPVVFKSIGLTNKKLTISTLKIK